MFAGQSKQIVLSYEQAVCLASPVRSEAFWTFSALQPRSVAEVAKDIGKSAQSLHYHVNQLVEVGLLIPAGERQRHARTETLYVWSSENILYESSGSKAYREEYVRAFSAVTRTMVREVQALNQVVDFNPSAEDLNRYWHSRVRLTETQVKRLDERMKSFIEDVRAEGVGDPTAIRIHVLLYCCPSAGESKRMIGQRKAKSSKKA
jgi:predicted ArsR family transcriptional regulator